MMALSAVRPLSSIVHGIQGLCTEFQGQAFLIILPAYLAVCLAIDSRLPSVQGQYVLGVCTLAFLLASTWRSTQSERRRVWVVVCIATALEIFCSIVWGIYRYRFGNVPLYVPWGHGLVYLFALRLAGTQFMHVNQRMLRRLALVGSAGAAAAGLTIEPLLTGRVDLMGAVLWPLFLLFLLRRNFTVYVAAFVVTTYLELVGTGLGTWTWSAITPILGTPCGNPPSVIAAGYCVLDWTALWMSDRLPLWYGSGRSVMAAAATSTVTIPPRVVARTVWLKATSLRSTGR